MNRREFNQGIAATAALISGCGGGGGGSDPAAGALPPAPAPAPQRNPDGSSPAPAAPAPTPAPTPAVRAAPPGICTNLCGMQTAEFNLRVGPGTRNNVDFTVARRADVQWLAAQGFTKSRLPIQWEMLQPMLFDTRANAQTIAIVGSPGNFNGAYLGHIQSILDAHADAGMRCLIDLHNYCRYRDFRYQADGSVTGLVDPGGGAMPYTRDPGQVYTRIFATAPGATLVPAHLSDFWTRAARLWKDHPGFGGYGLMNEPFRLPAPGGTVESTDDAQDLFIWPAFARAAIDAIRALDPSGPIYLNGNSWGGAFSIESLNPAWPLAGTNLVYEVHLYLDGRNTGQAFDFDTEVARNFTAGLGSVPITLDTGVDRLRIAVEWARPRSLTLSLAETGMPVDDPRWYEMFKRTVDFARANGVEVLSWNGGNHWSLRNTGLHDVPGWHQNKTLEAEMSSVLKASAGLPLGELFDDGPGFAQAGTSVTITVWARGHLASPVTLAIASSNGGALSSPTVTVPAGANGQASFSFMPAANAVTTLTYTVLSGSVAAPSPRKVYSLADPVAYAATSLPDAGLAILAKYGASRWAMADGYTDYLLGAPAAPGEDVRAVADSGWGSSASNAMEMLNCMNTERDPGMAVPVMREVNGRRCTDHSAPNTSGFWCRKVIPVAGVQPNPRNRMPYGLQDPHFAIAAISVPDPLRSGLVFQASRAGNGHTTELALTASRPQARWTDAAGGSLTLTAPAALPSTTPAVLTLSSAPGAQRLRVNSQEVAAGSATFSATPLDQMLIAWGFQQSPREGFGGNMYAVVSGRGAPTPAELGVLERYMLLLAGARCVPRIFTRRPANMEYRQLGRSGLSVSPLCLGGNVFGWTADERTSFALLDAWVEAGFNAIDTADVYSRWSPGHQGGESETVIGRWLKQGGRRDKVVIATKVGFDMGEGKGGLSPRWIEQAVNDSLRRLQTDCIDLYQAHKDDFDTPLEETLDAFAKLMKAGKVRAIGASNYGADRLRQALAISQREGLPRYESLQPLYNMYDRAVFESELRSLCIDEGLGVISFYALAAGFLAGKYRSAEDAGKSPRGAATVKKYLNDRGLKILAALDEAAGRIGEPPARIAIAWAMAQPGVTAPIASASTTAQLHELVQAARLTLDRETIELLDRASA